MGLWKLEKGGWALKEESCLDHLKFSGAVKMNVCCLPVTTALANERCRNFTFPFAREETEAQEDK